MESDSGSKSSRRQSIRSSGQAPIEGLTNIGWQIVLAPFALFAGMETALLAVLMLMMASRAGRDLTSWTLPMLAVRDELP